MNPQLMTPISDAIRTFDVKIDCHEKVAHAMMAWALHSASYSETRTILRFCTNDSPTQITDNLAQWRYSHPLYIWKLAALKALAGDESEMDRLYENGSDQLFDAHEMSPFKHPKIAQPLLRPEGEKILAKAIEDVTPLMFSLYKTKVGVVTKLMHSHGLGLLRERAVLTFRWEYPFCRNPGACINTAISNYANNIVRDATTKGRQTFTGKKSNGDLKNAVQSFDEVMDGVGDPSTMKQSDLHLDLSTLDKFDQTVVDALLYDVDPTHDVKSVLAARLGASDIDIDASFDRLSAYLKHGVQASTALNNMATGFNSW
jgi:hypothetical protein